MKILCLIRHAKSSWDDPSLPDQERPLNKRGLRDAPLMGKRLADHQMRVDAVWASPAQRAVETARLIAKAVKFPQKEIKLCDRFYTSSVDDLLLEISTCPDKVKTLLVFGHNPVISEFADLLISQDRDADIGSIPTCGIVAIELALSSWQKVHMDAGRMLFFDYPKKGVTPV